MKELLEQGYGFVPVCMIAGISLLVRFILVGYYGALGRACKNFGQTQNATVSYIREDLLFRKKSNMGMKSVTVYVECRLAERKVCGIRLGTLECITEQSLLLVVLGGVLTAFAGVLWNCDGRQILFILFAGGMSFLGLLFVDLVTGLREKHRRIRLSIRDYIENGVHKGEAREALSGERIAAKEKKEKREKVKKSAKTVRYSVGKKNRRKPGKAQEEKRRLTEELLRERRQMEARSFAQMRKEEKEPVKEQPEISAEERKQPEEGKQPEGQVLQAVEQAEAEAAATQFTYEDLLGEVLAEYLV